MRHRTALLACVALGAFAGGVTVVARTQEPPAEQVATPAPEEPATTPAPAVEKGPPPYSKKGADTCIACHDDEVVLSLFKTRHGRRADPRSPFGHGQLQCEACHGPGGEHGGRVRSGKERPPIPHFGSQSTSTPEARNGMCLGCHQSNMKHGWQGSTHDREGLACANCHTMHTSEDPVLVEAAQPEVCFGCHQQQKAQTQLPFTHPVRHGQMACAACHDPHGTSADFNLVKQTLNDTCYSCHAEKRGPFLWEHAPVAENCTNCHRPHGSSQPALLAQRPPLLCQQCHSQQGHPSVPLSPNALPGANPIPQFLGLSCLNCHSQVHGSNHPSGAKLTR